jgi:hypothetical protein
VVVVVEKQMTLEKMVPVVRAAVEMLLVQVARKMVQPI